MVKTILNSKNKKNTTNYTPDFERRNLGKDYLRVTSQTQVLCGEKIREFVVKTILNSKNRKNPPITLPILRGEI